ncbi:MAG: protein-disulfide reductase DsbD domain-containing protein [Terriglobia bacterium]
MLDELLRNTLPARIALLCLLTAIAVPAGAAPAQQPAVVKARIEMAPRAVSAGSTARAKAIAKVAPGYHINAHHPSLSYLIPTELHLQPGKAFAVERIDYPPGKIRRFAFSDTGLSVYEGAVTIAVLLKVNPAIAPGEYTLQGKLVYQACNDHACLPPASVPLQTKVRVTGARAPAANSHGSPDAPTR